MSSQYKMECKLSRSEKRLFQITVYCTHFMRRYIMFGQYTQLISMDIKSTTYLFTNVKKCCFILLSVYVYITFFAHSYFLLSLSTLCIKNTSLHNNTVYSYSIGLPSFSNRYIKYIDFFDKLY